eukprot:TCONS_00025298-protein
MSDKEELLGIEDVDLDDDLEDDSEVEFEFPLKNVVGGESRSSNQEDQNNVTIDEYLIKTGECGKYQIIMVFLMGFAMIPMSFPPLIFYYIGYDPPWSCTANVSHPNGTFCTTHNASQLFKHTENDRCSLNQGEWHYMNHGRSSVVTEFNLVCKDAWLDALTGSIVFVGWGIGILTLGYLSDQYGRKKILYPAMLLTLLALMAHAFVTSIWQLLVVRFIMGFVYSGPALNHYILSTEIVGPNRRALASTLSSCAWPIGAFLMTIKAYYLNNWRHLALFSSVPYMFGLITCICVPESFRWLHVKGRTAEAEKILQKASNCNNTNFINDLSLEKYQNSSQEKAKKVSYLVLFKSCKLFVMMISQAFIWFNSGMVYYALSWAFSDLGGNMYLNFVWSTLIELPGALISYFLLNFIGRKKTCIIIYLLTGLFCLVVTCIPESEKVARLVFGLLGKLMASAGFMSIYMWSSEIYPTCLRTQGMGINIVTSRAGAATSPFIKLLNRIHPAAPFGLMTTTCFISMLLAFVLPETFRKPTRETLDDIYQDNKTYTHKIHFASFTQEDGGGDEGMVRIDGNENDEDIEDTEHLLASPGDYAIA